jgi:tetratricopeptide (TPR) repeat protein
MKMRFFSNKIVLVCAFFAAVLPSGFAQNLAQTYAFAQQAYTQQNDALAIETYERVLFFEAEDSLRPMVYYHLAQCYFNTKNYAKAANYYDLVYHLAQTDSQKTAITLKKIPCLLAQKQHTAALTELYSLAEQNNDPTTRQTIDFYYGVTFFAMNEFEKSQQYFINAVTDTAAKIAIAQAFIQNKTIDKLKPQTAQWLSTFVPGLGQFYAGDAKNGLNSMVLTGIMGVWAISVARSGTYLDAVFTVLPWFQRYYNGGRERSKIIAEQAIAQRRYQIYIQLLNAVAFDKKR